MLRSGATSPLTRFLGYVFAVACAVLFGYTFFIAVVAAFTTGSLGVAAWVLGSASICMTLVVLATAYVVRRPYTGGYFLIALACVSWRPSSVSQASSRYWCSSPERGMPI